MATYSSILFFFFFNFILFLNFTILYWFCQILKWIHHRYTCVPHPEPSSLLSPHTIPLGRPSAPAPSIQYRASNLDWWLISYMIFYMFQCHSPKSSHPPWECRLVQPLWRTVWRFLKKTANRTAIWPSNPTTGHTHRGNQNWKRQVYPNVHRSTVYNS